MSAYRTMLFAGATAVAMLLAPAVRAQDDDFGMPGECGMMGEMGMGAGMMMRRGAMHEGRMPMMMTGRLDRIKSELGITEAQTAAWDAFAAAVKARGEAMQAMHAGMRESMTSGTPVERMTTRLQMMQSMVDGMKSSAPALETLYKALTDDQKKKADRLLGMGF